MTCYRFEKLDPRLLLSADGVDSANHITTPVDDSMPHAIAEIDATGQSESSTVSLVEASNASPSHDDNNPHMDPARAGEHQALLNLVPHEQATHRAVADGAWSIPATWEGGIVPTDAAHVLIPHEITVEVDDEFAARLATIRVDGTLNFATDVDTRLIVDTFVVAVDGTLNIGTAEQPVSPNVSANILFTDNGPIDTNWDPTVLSRGLISHGSATVHGAAKSGPVDLAMAPESGDTVLQLSEPVVGWRAGDRVLVPGVVRPLENNRGVTQLDEDEIVTITSISPDGRTIEFAQPLQHDHVPPRTHLDLPVSNLDRNVRFASENTTDPQRAGHVMFMHSPNAAVHYASFDHIGRNDKSIETTDPELDDEGNLIPETGLNARGRYSVHFHRIGSQSTAAHVSGSVVENSPGWGFVNHDSHVVFTENTTYNVKGAGFVTEVGSERGSFISNLAVRSRGKNFYQPNGASDKGLGTGFGSVGHGFWLQSATVELINNVAAGHAQEGIFIHSRSVTEFNRELPTYASLIDTPIGTPLEFSANSSEPAIRDDMIRTDQAAMAEMSGNTVFASGAGLGVRWRRQSDAVLQGTNGDTFENFEIWNVEWAGIHLGYVSGLTLRNGLILGNVDDPLSLSNRELDDRASEPSEFHTSVGKGIAANRNSKNLKFENLEIAGFTVGIQTLTQSHTLIDTVVLQNIEDLVIVTPQATGQSGNQRRIDARNVFHIPLSPSSLNGETQYNVRLLKQLNRTPVAGGSSAAQEWSAFSANDEIYYNGHRLYFREQAEDAVPFPTDEIPSFMNNAPYQQYVDQTNLQLLDAYNVALGNAVAPAEAFDALPAIGVDALAVTLDTPVTVPPRVEFSANENPTTWSIDENDLEITWRSKSLSESTQWRVYLIGPNGTQEIGRTGVAEDYGHVVVGSSEAGWLNWNFLWPTVGSLPPQWQGAVELGEQTLVAAADGSPAVYLGRINVAPALSEVNLGIAADAVLELPIHTPHSNINELEEAVFSSKSFGPNTTNDVLAKPTSPDQRAFLRQSTITRSRTAYRPAVRELADPIEAALEDEELLGRNALFSE